jgi:acyl-CoA synthetase (AMP-forming)/AMP-acid ligase II
MAGERSHNEMLADNPLPFLQHFCQYVSGLLFLPKMYGHVNFFSLMWDSTIMTLLPLYAKFGGVFLSDLPWGVF